MNKQIKIRIQLLANAWCAEKYAGLESRAQLPTPGRLEIANCLKAAWDDFLRKWQ
eukprot:IDg18363t1